MKKVTLILMAVSMVLGLSLAAGAAPTWYQVTFTGTDVWTYSADNAGQARTDQTAPRRYRDWTQPAGSEVQATTYGLNGGLPGTGFGVWAPSSGFAFDEINLWGKGGAAALAWGEKYVSVANDPDGVASWKVISAPPGWTYGIVLANQVYNPGSGAFPVWRSAGDADMLGIANMNDPSYVFTFQVLISNPETAFETDGKLRVFFGGYNDDEQMVGPGNHEVSGVMTLEATPVPVPEPAALGLLGLGLAFIGLRTRRS